jgi:hypothetical protein
VNRRSAVTLFLFFFSHFSSPLLFAPGYGWLEIFMPWRWNESLLSQRSLSEDAERYFQSYFEVKSRDFVSTEDRIQQYKKKFIFFTKSSKVDPEIVWEKALRDHELWENAENQAKVDAHVMSFITYMAFNSCDWKNKWSCVFCGDKDYIHRVKGSLCNACQVKHAVKILLNGDSLAIPFQPGNDYDSDDRKYPKNPEIVGIAPRDCWSVEVDRYFFMSCQPKYLPI